MSSPRWNIRAGQVILRHDRFGWRLTYNGQQLAHKVTAS
jgi:YD repeat-containing protein